MTGQAEERLARPEMGPLADELARRFGGGETPVTVFLRDVPFATRRSIADLLGSDREPPPNTRVRVDRLIVALGLGSVAELRAAVEAVRGPLANRRAEREARRAARESLWSWLAREAGLLHIGGDLADLTAWVGEQRSAGVRGGIDVHRRRLESAIRVLQAMPADGVSLSVLANECARDPHALDYGRTLSGMVLDALAAAFGCPSPANAEAARTLWETAGVVPDPHSSTVLVLGLLGGEDTPLQRWLAAAVETREPVVLSLSNLRCWPLPPLPAGSTVFVVENPSLIAEAVGSWTRQPRVSPVPLVCSSGRPTVATVMLLRQLGANGAALYQHADFDPTGLSITGWLAERAGTIPWKMTSSDYLSSLPSSGPNFTGSVPVTPWDPALQLAMEREHIALYEEETRAQLLDAMRGRVKS